MPEENSQNQSQTQQGQTGQTVQPNSVPADQSAPLPDWLKNVQGLQAHEEKGAPLIQQGYDPVHGNFAGDSASRSATQSAQTFADPADASAVAGLDPSASAFPVDQSPLKISEPDAGNALAADAPLPLWLQKAGAEPLSAPGVTAANAGLPAGAAVAPAAQPAIVEQTPAVQIQTQPQVTGQTPAAQSAIQIQSVETYIPGLLETKPPETAINPVPAVPAAVQSSPEQRLPAGTGIQSVPVAAAVPAPSAEPAKIVPTAVEEKKNDTLESVKKGMFSFLDFGKKTLQKSAVAIQAGKAAGAPEVPKPLPPAEAAKKAVQDKATAIERQELIDAEKVYQSGLATIRDLISPSSMEIQYDRLRVEGLYTQTFFVYSYPRYLDTNWLSPVVNFDVTMDISQFIYPIDSAAIMSVLKKKVAQMESSMRMAEEKGNVRDPALETALEDAEELRTQIQRGQEKFFQFGLYFTIYGEDDKKLEKVSKQLESLLGAKLILTKKSELQMEHGFNSTLPLCLDELEVTLNMNTSPLSSTFPFSSSDLTSNEGILYGLNRHNDSLIIFDRFSLENANSVVFAKSGAGKSYCVKLEILRYLMLGTDVIVIDPENEYEALAQTVGGSYLRVSLTSDRRINPFDLPSALQDEELQPGDLLRSNIINLHGLLKIMLGGVTPLEEGILDKALNDVYAVKGITMDIVDPSKTPPPTMEDLYDILVNMDGGQALAQRLQKYTQGTYAGIFNKPTNIDLGTGLMVFSIRDLEDALRPTAMYIILNYIWNRVRSRLKRRMLVIDEAWTMMQYEDSAKFLFGLVKRARKYYLGITTITQDVEDFVKSPYGKPVVTNSSMQLLLKQAPSAIEILSKTFNLTEGEKYMLLNSGVGQGLFFAGLKHVAIQIIASYTEDKIVTTNPEEILRGRTEEQQFQSAV
jgi:hypothetical protein